MDLGVLCPCECSDALFGGPSPGIIRCDIVKSFILYPVTQVVGNNPGSHPGVIALPKTESVSFLTSRSGRIRQRPEKKNGLFLGYFTCRDRNITGSTAEHHFHTNIFNQLLYICLGFRDIGSRIPNDQFHFPSQDASRGVDFRQGQLACAQLIQPLDGIGTGFGIIEPDTHGFRCRQRKAKPPKYLCDHNQPHEPHMFHYIHINGSPCTMNILLIMG